MKFKCSLVIFLLSFSLAAQNDYKTEAQMLLSNAFEQNQFIGASAGFSVNGEVKWASAVGFSNQKENVAFSESTITRIASISKPMTAIAIMQLYEQGKIQLDVPIQEYIPSFPTHNEGSISIRNLLNHTSGIDDYKSGKESENMKQYVNMEAAASIFKDRDLLVKPGTAFNYTTYGYVVLGLIIEKVSGMSYEAYMKTNIWDKAGMTNTSTIAPNSVSTVYHRNSKGKIKEEKPTNLSDRIPGGGIYSNLTDMLKFGDAILNYSLIKASTLQMMIENLGFKKEGNGYGFGWYLYGENPKYGNVFGHNGAQIGASTFLMLLPEQKTSIVVLANTSGAMQTVSNITIQLFDLAAESVK